MVDYDRVQDGQLKEDFIFFQSLISRRPERLLLDDGDELHIGAEYLFLNAPIPLALRGGFWHDPDHTVRYEPSPALDDIDRLFMATLPGGSSQAHYTFGAGLSPTRWLEINGAAESGGQDQVRNVFRCDPILVTAGTTFHMRCQPIDAMLQQHYGNLITFLLEGRVVPFLGAGANLCGRPQNQALARDQKRAFLPSGGELSAYLARRIQLFG